MLQCGLHGVSCAAQNEAVSYCCTGNALGFACECTQTIISMCYEPILSYASVSRPPTLVLFEKTLCNAQQLAVHDVLAPHLMTLGQNKYAHKYAGWQAVPGSEQWAICRKGVAISVGVCTICWGGPGALPAGPADCSEGQASGACSPLGILRVLKLPDHFTSAVNVHHSISWTGFLRVMFCKIHYTA